MGVERIHKRMYIRIVSVAARLPPKVLSRLIKRETVFRGLEQQQAARSYTAEGASIVELTIAHRIVTCHSSGPWPQLIETHSIAPLRVLEGALQTLNAPA